MLRPVLIAEADPIDQELRKAAFQSAGVQYPLVMVRDGREAIECLSTRDKELPHLVIP